MIGQNNNINKKDALQMLIDYQFDFAQLVNVHDNVSHRSGLIKLCRYSPNYEFVKMLFDHCKALKQCKIDITHCDIKRRNAFFYAAMTDINTMKYFLSNRNEVGDKNNDVLFGLNQTDLYGRTVAHHTARNPPPHIVETFKLLNKCNFNFNVYDNYGRLPIHCTCIQNCTSLLSWMINENVFDNDINCKTKYARNTTDNGFTPLYLAIDCNAVECVDVLCKQSTSDINITTKDVDCTLRNDNVSILKFLLCALFTRHKISSLSNIQSMPSSSIISSNQIVSMIAYCNITHYDDNQKQQCYQFLNDLLNQGYLGNNFNYIVFSLDYDLNTVGKIKNNHDDEKEDKVSEEYEIRKNLGNGTFGQVKLGKHKKSGDKVAIKYIDFQKGNDKSIQFITSEIESLKKLSAHENIISLLKYKILKNEVLLYFEYCQYGDLYQLLKRCDCFSMRISFKYFVQLLNAIYACHKINIVHRDLKLQNVLISDTFQLKVADFGLASIVENKNETMYNVGTPMYKSPELLENDTDYNISNIIVLKSCDVFSLSIILWQMMNGIEYLPFKLYENINHANYKLIKTKKFDKFCKIHQKCNMLSNNVNNDAQLLLRNLFEQMFSYNPHERITVESILKHHFVIDNDNDPLFYMNDATLEAFVRDQYHQTKHMGDDDIKHSKAPQTYLDSKQSDEMIASSSGFHGSQFLNRDSSYAPIVVNASKIYLNQNKIFYSYKPLIVMVGIANDNNICHNSDGNNILNDYINVRQTLFDIKHFDMIYHNHNHEIVYLQSKRQNNLSSISDVEKEFALSWRINDLDVLNDQVFSICESNSNYNQRYDCLIYIVSCQALKRLNNGIHILYDSYGNEYSLNDKIFDTFNNRKCVNLCKKAKIFVLNANYHNYHVDNNIDTIDCQRVDFVDQYKRIIGNKHNNGQNKKNGKDGSMLINAFCASLCNNIVHKWSDKNIKNDQNLNDIITETRSRMKKFHVENEIYDENYIPSRCKMVFTSFEPLESTRYYDASNTQVNIDNSRVEYLDTNSTLLEQIKDLKQRLIQMRNEHLNEIEEFVMDVKQLG